MLQYDYMTDVDVLNERKPIRELIIKKIEEQETDESSFSIGDLGEIIKKHKMWKKYLPRVEPFYALKANYEVPVIRLLADMGVSFDCASKDEIQMVLDKGIDPSRIIYANTFKQEAFIKYAKEKNVSLMTFDCENELQKIKSAFPEAKLLLRLNIDHNCAVKHHFRNKYGSRFSDIRPILHRAKDLELNIIGICFHVGSNVMEASAFETAIAQSRHAFDIGLEMGFNMTLLDIGGGFPGRKLTDELFEDIANQINTALDRYFPDDNIRVIAEPGRFFVSSAFTIAVNIITKKTVNQANVESVANSRSNDREYYVNDGIFGCFFETAYDPGCFIPIPVKNSTDGKLYKCKIWGPTCMPLDMIIEDYQLPDLEQGSWIYFENMGAYTLPMYSAFNSMPRIRKYFFCEQQLWSEVYP